MIAATPSAPKRNAITRHAEVEAQAINSAIDALREQQRTKRTRKPKVEPMPTDRKSVAQGTKATRAVRRVATTNGPFDPRRTGGADSQCHQC